VPAKSITGMDMVLTESTAPFFHTVRWVDSMMSGLFTNSVKRLLAAEIQTSRMKKPRIDYNKRQVKRYLVMNKISVERAQNQ
jgi:hypothetical protein